MNTPEVLGNHLRQARQHRGMSQTTLAAAAAVDQSQLSRLEAGSIVEPSLYIVARLAEALQLPLATLLLSDTAVFHRRLQQQHTPNVPVMVGYNRVTGEPVSTNVHGDSSYHQLLLGEGSQALSHLLAMRAVGRVPVCSLSLHPPTVVDGQQYGKLTGDSIISDIQTVVDSPWANIHLDIDPDSKQQLHYVMRVLFAAWKRSERRAVLLQLPSLEQQTPSHLLAEYADMFGELRKRGFSLILAGDTHFSVNDCRRIIANSGTIHLGPTSEPQLQELNELMGTSLSMLRSEERYLLQHQQATPLTTWLSTRHLTTQREQDMLQQLLMRGAV